MTTATRSFAGIPVSGDFHHGYDFAEQYGLDKFLPLFHAVANNPHIKRFGWTQYTPYFNDGEECVFGAGQTYFLTDEDVVDEQTLEDEGRWYMGENYSVAYGSGVLGKSEGYRESLVYDRNEPWVVALRVDAIAFEEAIEGGHFDHVLIESFGNRVEITVCVNDGSNPRIECETYDHD